MDMIFRLEMDKSHVFHLLDFQLLHHNQGSEILMSNTPNSKGFFCYHVRRNSFSEYYLIAFILIVAYLTLCYMFYFLISVFIYQNLR